MATCRPDSTREMYMTDRAELPSFSFAHLLRAGLRGGEVGWDGMYSVLSAACDMRGLNA